MSEGDVLMTKFPLDMRAKTFLNKATEDILKTANACHKKSVPLAQMTASTYASFLPSEESAAGGSVACCSREPGHHHRALGYLADYQSGWEDHAQQQRTKSPSRFANSGG